MNTIDSSPAETEAWKRKYYDALEQHEAKERQWAQADDLLRKTLSRLTLAADGQDALLDRQLKELRDAIRDRADSRQLRQRIEAMSESLVRLDSKRTATAAGPKPARTLHTLLASLNLPRGYARRVKALRKQLDDAPDTQLDALVVDIAGLLQDVMTELGTAAAGPGGAGLFGRLFGAADRAADKQSERTADRAAAATPVDSAGARELLLHLLDNLPAAVALHYGELRQQALRADNERELRRLAAQLAAGFGVNAPASAATTETDSGELLLQLLERLDLPADLEPRVAALKDGLEHRGGYDMHTVVRDIADLVADMRGHLQSEKQEIESFLTQLTERLNDIDSYVRGAHSARVESYRSGRDLGAVVQEQVRVIEDSVRAAAGLETLKLTVQQRIDAIIAHVDQHRRGEEQRHQEVEAQVAQLTERLRDMETESALLRERIGEEHRQALTDPLTGIPNRLAYQERIAQEYARWRRFHTPLALLVWDVDRFKHINDHYGHKAGDKVLKVIAGTLADNIRETDFLARYGGEEFVLLMTGTRQPAIQEVADKLRAAVETCGFHYRGDNVPITISCGIAEFREGDRVEGVFERADRALYRAKDQGRNRCVIDG